MRREGGEEEIQGSSGGQDGCQSVSTRCQCETKLLEGWVYLPLVKISSGSFAASGQILLPTEAKGTAPSGFTDTHEFTSRGRKWSAWLTKDGSAE